MNKSLAIMIFVLLSGCGPHRGPDKTLGGMILGGGWGAGAGAVVGNQTGNPGSGTAVGAGIGAGAGLLEGAGLDIAESGQIDDREAIDDLKMQVERNRRELSQIRDHLDSTTPTGTTEFAPMPPAAPVQPIAPVKPIEPDAPAPTDKFSR